MAGADADVRPGSESPKEDDATKATREELKHTAISEKNDQTDKTQRAMTPPETLQGQIGSPKKKRAHDQVDDDDAADSRHQRSRSRVGELSDVDDDDDDDDDEAAAGIGSGSEVSNGGGEGSRSDRAEPEKKRLRDEEEKAAAAATSGAADKDHKDSKPAAAAASGSAFASSGFAKLANSGSPFGSLAGAGAGGTPSLFSSAAASSTSPFGVLGGSTPATSAFAPAAAAKTTPTVPKLSFGGAATGASPFASVTGQPTGSLFGSAFGAGAGVSVFGSTLSGGRLTSFAKPGGSVFKSDKPAKPFGAPESEGEEEDEDAGGEDDEDDEASSETKEDKANKELKEKEPKEPKELKESGEEKKKPKLQRVAVNDGEMGEATLIQVRARMYYLDKDQGGWKERGAGMLKLNVPEACVEYDRSGSVIPASFDGSMLGGSEAETAAAAAVAASEAAADKNNITEAKASTGVAAVPTRSVVRLIMRQDSTLRVILNTVVLAATEFQERQTLKATTVLFTAFEGGEAKPVSVQVKMNPANAKTFLSTMKGVQAELRND